MSAYWIAHVTIHDMEQYNIGPILTFRGIDKIPEKDNINKDLSEDDLNQLL